MTPTLAVVHNDIGPRSSIGSIAAWAVRAGLERGWDVTAVCAELDPQLRPAVTHRPLYVPPRLHLLQWSVARQTVRRALGSTRPDVLLTYQPQVAALADVWHVQYLSRAARRAGGPVAPGLRAVAQDVQAAGVAALEDRYLHRLPPGPRLLFCSEVLRADFAALYGPVPGAGVLHNPVLVAPPTGRRLPDAELRAALTGGHAGPVVGFLGGGDRRKGGDLVVRAVAAEPGLFLLHAGPGVLDDSPLRRVGRSRGLGRLDDVTRLLDAVDALLVPSRFEPFGMVVAEAAARGVPVLVGPRVGAAPLVTACGAGAVWDPPAPLGPAVAAAIANRASFAEGGRRLAARVAPDRLADQLVAEFDAVLEARHADRVRR